jgi:nucleotide-binding universal stress UspA family protein
LAIGLEATMTTTKDFEPSAVVCALDFEQPVDGLLDTAVSLAQRFDATLHLVHVWMPAVALMPEGGMIPTTSDIETVSSTLTEQLDAIASAVRRSHSRVVTQLLPGTPWREIVRYAEDHDCDLIVAGTHGRTGLSRLVEGSVAERVVRASSIPVLVVPIHRPDEVAPSKRHPAIEHDFDGEEEAWKPEA